MCSGLRFNVTTLARVRGVRDDEGYLYPSESSPQRLFQSRDAPSRARDLVVMALVLRNRNRALQRAFNAAPALNAGYQVVRRMAQGGVKRRRLQQGRSSDVVPASAPLTGQHDYKTDYRKRRLTRRGRFLSRRRGKWRRRVLKVTRESLVGSSHIIRREHDDIAAAANTSNSFVTGIYGLDGYDGGIGTFPLNVTNDVGSLFNELDTAAWNASRTAVGNNRKLTYFSSSMEVTISNTGTVPVLMEAYFIMGRNRVPSDWITPHQMYISGFNKQPQVVNDAGGAIVAPDGPLSFSDLGTTPFQNAVFCRNYKIVKRMKFVIPAGSSISQMIRDTRPHTWTVQSAKGFVNDRAYKGILWQFQGHPSSANQAEAATINVLNVRRYRAKLLPNTNTTDLFDPIG